MLRKQKHSFAVAYFWRGEADPSCLSKFTEQESRLPLWAFVFWSVWKDLRTLESGVREMQIRVGDPSQLRLRDFSRVPATTEY